MHKPCCRVHYRSANKRAAGAPLFLDPVCMYVYTVPLKCNVALARKYFARISILDALLSASTRTNSTRVEADVEDLTG